MFEPGMIVVFRIGFQKLKTGIVLSKKPYVFSGECVLTLLTKEMTTKDVHESYVRPYTGSVS
jgi:hypothetical protein